MLTFCEYLNSFSYRFDTHDVCSVLGGYKFIHAHHQLQIDEVEVLDLVFQCAIVRSNRHLGGDFNQALEFVPPIYRFVYPLWLRL